jgi:hypothetical protein
MTKSRPLTRMFFRVTNTLLATVMLWTVPVAAKASDVGGEDPVAPRFPIVPASVIENKYTLRLLTVFLTYPLSLQLLRQLCLEFNPIFEYRKNTYLVIVQHACRGQFRYG